MNYLIKFINILLNKKSNDVSSLKDFQDSVSNSNFHEVLVSAELGDNKYFGESLGIWGRTRKNPSISYLAINDDRSRLLFVENFKSEDSHDSRARIIPTLIKQINDLDIAFEGKTKIIINPNCSVGLLAYGVDDYNFRAPLDTLKQYSKERGLESFI